MAIRPCPGKAFPPKSIYMDAPSVSFEFVLVLIALNRGFPCCAMIDDMQLRYCENKIKENRNSNARSLACCDEKKKPEMREQ